MSEPLAEGAPATGEAPRDNPPTKEPADKTANSSGSSDSSTTATGPGSPNSRRRRGSRGGRNRSRARPDGMPSASSDTADGRGDADADADARPELPDRLQEGRPQSVEAAERALVRKPQIGDSRP